VATDDRQNKRECPHCHEALNGPDNAFLQTIIDQAASSGLMVQDDTPRLLSCGHKASFEAASFGGGGGFWLVPRR